MKRFGMMCMILLLVPELARAVEHDAQLWTEAGVRYDVSKKLRLKFDQHFRLHDDISDPKSAMPELAVSYRPLKFLRLDAGYRLVVEFYRPELDPQLYSSDWHRVFADVRLRVLRSKPFTLRYRLRFQEQYGWNYDPGADRKEYEHKLTLRNKIMAELKYAAGFEQFLAVELFNRLNDSVRTWHKVRTTLGLRYLVNSHELTMCYRLETYLFDDSKGETTRNVGDMNHILALGYHFRF